MDNNTPKMPDRRFTIQVFSMDTNEENPVRESYAVACPDAKSAQHLYDMIQRLLQLVTHKPIV